MMTQTAYLGISQSKRAELDGEVQQIKAAMLSLNISLNIFVDNYRYEPGREASMMTAAFRQIDQSDLLIVELSHKAIGVGIEVGYAYAKNIPVIYLKKETAKWSTTVHGCAQHVIEYTTPQDLNTKLLALLSDP